MHALDPSYALLHLGETIKNLMGLLALCSLRLYAAFFIAPITNDQTIQGPMRNGMCLVLGTYVAWGQPAHLLENYSAGMLIAMLLKEGLTGVLLGFAFSSVFWIAQGAGALMDNCAGFNNAQQTNPLSGEQSTPLSNLLAQLVISAFYMLGGMTVCVGLLFESYHWWPLAELAPKVSAGLMDFLTVQVDTYFSAVLKIAAPSLLILVLIDLGFGLLAKTAEKLEPNNLSQSVKGAVATVMLALLVALFFQQAKANISLMNLQHEFSRWGGAKKVGP